MTNQLRQSGNPVTSEFELALLHFILSFKNHVLTDSRMIMLGTSIADDGLDTPKKPVDTVDGIYNESN